MTGPLYVVHLLQDTWGARAAGRKTTGRDALIAALPGLAHVFKTIIVRTSRSTYYSAAAREGYFGPLRNAANAHGVTLIASADSPQAALWRLLERDHAPGSGPADWSDFERSIQRAALAVIDENKAGSGSRGGPAHLDMERCLWADAKNNAAAAPPIAWNETRTMAVRAALGGLPGGPLLWYHPLIHPDYVQQAAYNRLTAALLQVIRFRFDDVLLDAIPWLYQKQGREVDPVAASVTTLNMYHRAGFEPRRVYLGMISDHAGPNGFSPAEFMARFALLATLLATQTGPPLPADLPAGAHRRQWYFAGPGKKLAAHAAAFAKRGEAVPTP